MSELLPERAGLYRPQARPCASCPYRQDVPSGVWHPSEYDKLPKYDGDVPDQAEAGAFGLFFCHLLSGRLCAGWVGCHDMLNSLAVRLHAAKVDPIVYEYVSPVPLWGSGAEAAAHGMREIDRPGQAAMTKQNAITRTHAARRKRRGDTSKEQHN